MNTMIYTVTEILRGTPQYVWVLLALLIYRGVKFSKDAPLDLKKMLIMPTIFIIWGLDKMLFRYANPSLDLIVYIGLALIGSAFGYLLYSQFRTFYMKDQVIYRKGSYVTLVIILINFLVKYTMSVMVSINPLLYSNSSYCILRSILSGISVGLFIGGLLHAYYNQNKLINENF